MLEAVWFAIDVSNSDVLLNMRQAWEGFVSSGQAWAALFGMAFGYFVAKFTSYG